MNKKTKSTFLTAIVLIIVVCGIYLLGGAIWKPMYHRVVEKKTLEQAIVEIRPNSEEVIQSYVRNAGLTEWPSNLTFLAFKEEQKLEVWTYHNSEYKHLHTYDILANRGKAGPKLKEGDRQIPEGLYNIIGFNPNSSYTLSMKLNYPNQFDKEKAELEQRTNLGGDIFIHGKAVSIGCIAIGDEAIRELFLLVYEVGKDNVKVIISPNDLRVESPPEIDTPWAEELYNQIKEALKNYT